MMNLRRILIRKLWAVLPPDEQLVLVYDFLDWLYPDLPPAVRRKKVKRLAPRLMEWIAEGEIGLSLVVYQHLKRLPLLSTLRRWAGDPEFTSD